MRRLFALILVGTLWLGLAAPATADVAGLVPCSESPAFQERAAKALNTTGDPESGRKRFERYSAALCGPEGLPRLITDGRWSHAGDFILPAFMFLYIAGWIGAAGRSYLIANRKTKNPGMGEIQIDVPRAIGCMVSAFAWPVTYFRQLTTGTLVVDDNEVTVSPR